MNPSSYAATLQEALGRTDFSEIARAVGVIEAAHRDERQVFAFGNGASAALASHMATDAGKLLVSEDAARRRKRLRIQSLNDNAPWLTAIGNDIGYDQLFTEQLANHLRPNDVVIGISGSGSSPNVLRALEFARGGGATLVGFTSARRSADMMASLCHVCLRAPLDMMEQIEDLHVAYHHMIVRRVYALITDQQQG